MNVRSDLNRKVVEVFGRLAIDKRRLLFSQLQKRGISAYVAEWVLESVVPGVGPLLPEEAHKVQDWAKRVIPGPKDQNIIKHRLSQGETVRVLTPVEVEVDLNRKKKPSHFARLRLLGIDEAYIPTELLEYYPDLLRHGMWGVVELSQLAEGTAILSFKPMQATVNLELFKDTRRSFSLEEWRALLLISMGYNPLAFNEEETNLLLARLLPLVQKNLHLMELAPKGTGKSYIYENISPKVRLVSGGNVSPAVLFVNNATGQWGLLARFAVVVLDEVQTLRFDKPEEIVGGLKGYLANGKLTRGGLYETASDCGLVLLANIQLDERQRPVRDILVEELPFFLQETAFLDRIRGIIPGWRLPKLSGDYLIGPDTEISVGLKSDFFGDVLLAMREDLGPDQYCARTVSLKGERPYKRNEESVRTLAAGFMKVQFPHGDVSREDFERFCLRPAIEMRQLVWDQLYRLDGEYRQYEHNLECA
ncbi:BREX system Lon protease-like protein BrxL [Kyrpidia sp.]|uniref:BREX system Lon protease-like protein BrxL n=1 Tax=Kyrpidia sp. TaxID=2073077 RepID=UPI0025848114|nr:BREX system Lon protease-like protein BrxL [Kyrpidia sp.]MCL6576922.1 BREX system Lon protease-like protein BrxL [Kyrpidia sp.]